MRCLIVADRHDATLWANRPTIIALAQAKVRSALPAVPDDINRFGCMHLVAIKQHLLLLIVMESKPIRTLTVLAAALAAQDSDTAVVAGYLSQRATTMGVSEVQPLLGVEPSGLLA